MGIEPCPPHHAHRRLSSNLLSGSIPDSIGNLAQLTQLCVGCCVLPLLPCVAMSVGVWVHGRCGAVSVALGGC